MTTTTVTRGAHHIGLTVPSLADSRAFFVDTLGYAQVGDVPSYPAVFLSDGSTMITLWQAVDPDNAVPFDRKNVIGLHHMALAVESAEALDALHQKLTSAPGTTIEFAPESLGGGAATHMMCTIPGGIRVEFIAA